MSFNPAPWIAFAPQAAAKHAWDAKASDSKPQTEREIEAEADDAWADHLERLETATW